MTMLPDEKPYSIEDINQLPEGCRAELIDGDLYMLAAPSRMHQKIVAELLTVINNHIKESGKPCDAYTAPFAVFLGDNYIEPDLSIICDKTKLSDQGCKGAPDWIIEVLSPSTAINDYVRKLALYERAGVREYWIVNPDRATVRTYVFSETTSLSFEYTFDDKIPVSISPGFTIRIADLLSP